MTSRSKPVDTTTLKIRQERQQSFEELVRQVQRESGWSLAKIAEKIELPPSTMYRWMRGGKPRGGDQYNNAMTLLCALTGRVDHGHERDRALDLTVLGLALTGVSVLLGYYWFSAF